MTKDMQIFNNTEFGQVRTINNNGEVWFVGKDVCDCLGISKARTSIALLDDDEKDTAHTVDTIGRNKEMTVVSEAGLYSLVLRSRKPNAKKFKRWITHEVLPSIRKHGMYATLQTAKEILSNPQVMIDILQALQREQEQRIKAENKNTQLSAKIEKDKPKVEFAERLLISNSNILVRELAKLITQNGYKIGQNKLYEYLRTNGYLIKGKTSDKNLPLQKYINNGLFKIKTSLSKGKNGEDVSRRTTTVTPRGQKYFLNLFAELKKINELAKKQTKLN